MNWLRSLFLVLFFLPVTVGAIAVDQNRLSDPAQEAQARELFKKYRCVVCDNQSIDDSNADVAEDLRAIVREQVAAGQDEAQITEYLVARYGDFVLLEPPIKARTLVLWFLPFVLLLLGVVALLLRRKKPTGIAAAQQSPEPSSEATSKLAAWRAKQNQP